MKFCVSPSTSSTKKQLMLMLVVRWNPWTGSIAQGLAYFLPDPVAPGLIPSAPKNFSEEKIVDGAEVAKVNQWLEYGD